MKDRKYIKDILYIILIIILFLRIYILIEENNEYSVVGTRATYSYLENINNPFETCYFAFSDDGEYVYTDTPNKKNYKGTYQKYDERSYIINGEDMSGSVIVLGEIMYFYDEKNKTIKKFEKKSNIMEVNVYNLYD